MATVTCPSCGQTRESHLRYCRSCGASSPVLPTTPDQPQEGTRCPRCARYAGLDATFCPHCGARLARQSAPLPSATEYPPYAALVEPRARSTIHQVFRWLFTIWLIAYPVLSCGPILLGAATGGASGGATTAAGLFVGAVYLLPWLIGLLVLGFLAVLTQ